MKKQDIERLRKAFEAARDLSQDANSQTGAIIVSPQNEIMSKGANRMHYGSQDRFEIEMDPRKRVLLGRPEKYTKLLHAERDVIYVANRKGITLEGSTLYATWTPCDLCAEVAINNGIKRFVTHASTDRAYREARKDICSRNDWTKSIEKAREIFSLGGVEYIVIDEPIGRVAILFDDKTLEP